MAPYSHILFLLSVPPIPEANNDMWSCPLVLTATSLWLIIKNKSLWLCISIGKASEIIVMLVSMPACWMQSTVAAHRGINFAQQLTTGGIFSGCCRDVCVTSHQHSHPAPCMPDSASSGLRVISQQLCWHQRLETQLHNSRWKALFSTDVKKFYI